MRKAILALFVLFLITCTASAQGSYTYDVTFTLTTASGYQQVSFDEQSNPLNAYGWVHVTSGGIDLWYSPDPNADLGNIPGQNEQDCYCSFDNDCGKGRSLCGTCSETCDWDIDTGTHHCVFTSSCK